MKSQKHAFLYYNQLYNASEHELIKNRILYYQSWVSNVVVFLAIIC